MISYHLIESHLHAGRFWETVYKPNQQSSVATVIYFYSLSQAFVGVFSFVDVFLYDRSHGGLVPGMSMRIIMSTLYLSTAALYAWYAPELASNRGWRWRRWCTCIFIKRVNFDFRRFALNDGAAGLSSFYHRVKNFRSVNFLSRLRVRSSTALACRRRGLRHYGCWRCLINIPRTADEFYVVKLKYNSIHVIWEVEEFADGRDREPSRDRLNAISTLWWCFDFRKVSTVCICYFGEI